MILDTILSIGFPIAILIFFLLLYVFGFIHYIKHKHFDEIELFLASLYSLVFIGLITAYPILVGTRSITHYTNAGWSVFGVVLFLTFVLIIATYLIQRYKKREEAL